ncbi:MAG: hypothetical protein ACPGLY_17610 [Rubripirellula sp.]
MLDCYRGQFSGTESAWYFGSENGIANLGVFRRLAGWGLDGSRILGDADSHFNDCRYRRLWDVRGANATDNQRFKVKVLPMGWP